MTRLSVNINKIATLRNARGANTPDLISVAKDIERFGAHGITVHPRPDQRHIRYSDVTLLAPELKTEFNIEGYPNSKFIDLVLQIRPSQVTLVPDAPDALTSNSGWNTKKYLSFLTEIVSEFASKDIRTSLFMDTEFSLIEKAKETGVDRIEFYTEPYAEKYDQNPERAIKPFVEAANLSNKLGLGINAGHDLNLNNLRYFCNQIDGLLEVSIGHALISDSLYFGLENTVQMYLNQLNV
ncbi:MAG: pyridoxine 5'-phosphate synthase [Flavobacteriales bacterium]|nr:pyridoxine 5'-phosphate synthase [Flavobacteriales bacterium]|tara:strand:+ start:189 stop:905 length:717 start_codon:yes stop_codon:yes gene_type:complete